MKTMCKNDSHIWTVETRSRTLAPGLDLVPGRRCLCGVKVLTNPINLSIPAESYRVEHIGSSAARLFAKQNPALKTW